MNQRYMEKLLNLAERLGLQVDAESGTLFGVKDGYTVNVCLNGQQNSFSISASVGRNGGLPLESELKKALKETKLLTGCTIQGHKLNCIIRGGALTEKGMNKIDEALSAFTRVLIELGYCNCCQNCAKEMPTESYNLGGVAALMCEECFTNASAKADEERQKELKKRENMVAGIVGALIGSVIGAAVIVLIGQLGYVSAISGVVIAICTLKGYELLGGKLTTVGIVISIAIMVAMIYIGNRIDWAVSVSAAYEASIFDSFRAIPELVSEGYIDNTYYVNLAMVYVFSLLGIIPTVIGAVSKRKTSTVTCKMTGMH